MPFRFRTWLPQGPLALPHLEIAARYLWTNLLPLPVVIVGLGVLLSQWIDIASLVAWGAVSIATWSVTLVTLQLFLRDAGRASRVGRWTLAICATLFVSSLAFASVAPAFWVEDNRINNVLLYVVLAAGLACAGAQSAPSIPVVVTNLAPYAVLFVWLTLQHERSPTAEIMSILQLCYIGLVALYAKAVWQLTREMLTLREDKEALIEKLRRAIADATAARDRAERASTAKSEFLANMSHELRTPLNAVLGFSEVIKDLVFGREDVDRYASYAANIHASGKHLLGLINDILDLSKIEAGKWQLQETRIKAVDLAREAVRLVEPQADEKDIRLSIDVPKAMTIFVDPRALRQIFVNLLSNAVKFTPRRGRVSLGIRRAASGALEIAVSDTGIGIARDDLPRVLEHFGQGRHDVVASRERGTGLGLPIVKGLVEAHGGSMRIDSEVGAGTTVTIDLPSYRIATPDRLIQAAAIA